MAKGNSVGSDAESRTPFLGDGLGESSDTSFGKGVVQLACIAVDTGGRGDVDDGTRSAVLDAEVRGGFSHEVEGSCAVNGDDVVPLLVGHFVDDAVPGVSGVVDDDVYLAVAELRGFLYESLDVVFGENISGYGNGAAAGGVDAGCYITGFFYE